MLRKPFAGKWGSSGGQGGNISLRQHPVWARPALANEAPCVGRWGPRWQLERRGRCKRQRGPHPARGLRRGQGRWPGGRARVAGAQSSSGQPSCLGCSSWRRCSHRSPSPSPAPGTAPSSLQRAPQVRARMQPHRPGKEVPPPQQPLPYHTLSSPGAARAQPPAAHAGQVYGDQPPRKLEPASEGKVQGPGWLRGGAPGQPAWSGHSVARGP